MNIVGMQEAKTLQQEIVKEEDAVAEIRSNVNAARRRLHLPERDYSNVGVGKAMRG